MKTFYNILLLAIVALVLLFVIEVIVAEWSTHPPRQQQVTATPTKQETKAEYEERVLAEQRARDATAIDKDRAKKSAEIVGAAKNLDTSIDPDTVTYTPHKWGLPIVQSVLIPTKFATEAGMIAVARRIDRDALDYQSVDVEIFDNEKAERLSRVEIGHRELTKSEHAFCKLHTLAVYRRNRGVNINELSLYDNESTGKVIKGDVRKIIRLTEGEARGGMLSNAIEERQKHPTAQLQWDGTLARTEDAKEGGQQGSFIGGVTLAAYKRLRTGMTYSEVVRILGRDDTDISSNDIGGFHTVMYQWQSDGIGNMNAMFQNGKLIQKAQFGLK